MKILVTGANGQLGTELQRTLSFDSKTSNLFLIALSSSEMDITNAKDVLNIINRHRPDIVINTAAYTAVDDAEKNRERAFLINRDGCENLANACNASNAKLIHISTDFVFDGNKNTPYQTSDNTSPIGVYGESKRAGEKIIQSLMPQSHIIIRTAWLYSVYRNNFVKTMLRLMKEKEQLSIVSDQVGTPTWTKGLAEVIRCFVSEPKYIKGGLFHWTDSGVCSWYDFAVAIQELALEKGLLKRKIPINAIPASAYPTAAARPSFSVLDKSEIEKSIGIKANHWCKELENMLDQLVKN